MSTSSLRIEKDATTIIAKVQKATHLFLPMDSSNTSIEEVVPSFSACFEFKNPDTPPMSFLLEMRSSPAAPTVYEEVQALWTRTDRRDNAVPLEIFMARLDRYVSSESFSCFADIFLVGRHGNFKPLPKTVSTLVESIPR